MNTSVFSRDAINARRRAVVKTLRYRALMVTITVVVAWLVVGDVGQAASIGFVANAVKTLTYYGYERLWDHVSWGVGASG
ncbi:DUF2061 domain-containing protein [Halorubrum sp. BOL3-1]|uniref:DUF2061 domain-containing protein n=1 Tax=Halorubrum sp. BOL3-1 TaxID=2497325 RepID=UPI001004E7CD|nr:DUF2061 domain-containing protein [Halorubrum sp. BOL3-1]QAU11942.1 DUF2061 domain-containing protein [Halorubrum sp. BOL3-1]